MDPITHAAVGAALGGISLGRNVGKRAMLYGAIAGVLPDLDILLVPFEDDVSSLTEHRGMTHCLLFVLVTSLLLGGLLARWHRRRSGTISFWRGSAFFLLCLLSHVLLDACTTYGTPLLLPFSNYRVAFNLLFIVDPFFTGPLVICVVVCGVFRLDEARRQTILRIGLALACLYLGLAGFNKWQAQQVFSASLANQPVQARRFMTAPTPLNNVVWYCLAETEDGYWLGYYSVLAKRQLPQFIFMPRQGKLIENIQDATLVEQLRQFSDGYYRLRQENGLLLLDVLKFGLFRIKLDGEQGAYCFAIHHGDDGRLTASNVSRWRDVDVGRLLANLWAQAWGRATTQ